MASIRMEDDAFGANLSQECRDGMDRIRNNDPTLTVFSLRSRDDAAEFSDEGWELLGRYITNNSYLTKLDLKYLFLGALADSKMSLLFNILTGSSSLKILKLGENGFGSKTVQSMVPCLKSCPNLDVLHLSGAQDINTDCFRVILEALEGSSVEELNLRCCSITDITALATCNLPNLKKLYLYGNKINRVPSLESCTSLELLRLGHNEIGKEECEGIAKLLANRNSSLQQLFLDTNSIDDEGAEIIANSLTHNTALKDINLNANEITERGLGAFLKLLNDVSSIERTYKSNHTLRFTLFGKKPFGPSLTPGFKIVMKHVHSALGINKQNEGNSHAAGRAKIISTQLNSTTRRKLCQLQGIEYSYSAIFAGIDPVLLPELIALSSREDGQNELYRILVGTGPDLFSLTNR